MNHATLNDFVDHIMEFVNSKIMNEESSLLCWSLHSSYSHFEKSEEEWLQMDIPS